MTFEAPTVSPRSRFLVVFKASIALSKLIKENG